MNGTAEAPTTAPRRFPEWLLALGLLVLVFAAYQPAWRGEAIFDDDDHLTPVELRSVDGLRRIWTELGVVSQYYPVTHSVFWLEHRLWGDAMLGYHLVNIALHVVAALLLVKVLQRLGVPGAWLAGAIFAVHPVQAESVAWISELKNTLSGALYLGAAWCYFDFDSSRRRGMYFAAAGLFGVGLLAKGVIATFPAAVLVVLWWKRGTLAWRRDVLPLVPFFAVAIAMGTLTAWVERRYIGADGAAFVLTSGQRLLIAGRALWFYAGKLLWPADLAFIYPRWDLNTSQVGQWAYPVAALIAVAVLLAFVRRSRGPLAACLFFAGNLFPVLGFLNVYPFLYSYVADHYQYLASVGVIVGVTAWAVAAGNSGPRAAVAVRVAAVIAVGLLAMATWRQAKQYAGVETLWQATLAKNPTCFVAHSNLGNYYLQKGDAAAAVRHSRRAIELRPEFAEAHNNLGNALRATGDLDGAKAEYAQALAVRPTFAVGHFNLGAIALERGERDTARREFEAAVRLRPEYVKARTNLASVLLEQGKIDEAGEHLRAALKVRPDDADAHANVGNLLRQQGRAADALQHYERALASDPRNASIRFNRGAVWLDLGRFEAAAADFEAVTRAAPNFAPAQHALGITRRLQDRRDEAIACFRAALRLDPNLADSKAALDELLAEAAASTVARTTSP